MNDQELHKRVRAQIAADRERSEREGARQLGITVTQFRALKARALRRDPKVASRSAAAPETPRKSFVGRCFQTVEITTYADGSQTRRRIK